MSKRGEFLLKALEIGMSGDEILEYVDQFEGKTNEEKDELAEHFLKELENRKNI